MKAGARMRLCGSADLVSRVSVLLCVDKKKRTRIVTVRCRADAEHLRTERSTLSPSCNATNDEDHPSCCFFSYLTTSSGVESELCEVNESEEDAYTEPQTCEVN